MGTLIFETEGSGGILTGPGLHAGMNEIGLARRNPNAQVKASYQNYLQCLLNRLSGPNFPNFVFGRPGLG